MCGGAHILTMTTKTGDAMRTLKSFKQLKSIVVKVVVDVKEVSFKAEEYGPANCLCCRKERRLNKGRNLGKMPLYKNINRTSINPNKAA